MYLKSIEIQGFKSFANRIELTFKDGITGIVGPNGSGKSNVADAVRWVLGEQSARELRGSSMQDVIFSGTQSRKSMGMAMVAITLDNSDHSLNLPYDEVTVSRRVYRSGSSEYSINGNGCRLKDIAELFYDTGIGQEGYSIIGQGQIDRILSGRPEERRELFDEAAGIVKFKRRKAAAIKNLAEVDSDLVRINDIVRELDLQKGPLEEQSVRAREYMDCRERLKELDITLFVLDSRKLNETIRGLEQDYLAAEGDSGKARKNQELLMTLYEQAKSKSDELEAEIEVRRGRLNSSVVLKGQLEGQVNVLRERLVTIGVSDEHFTGNIRRLENDISEYEESLKHIDQRVSEADEKVERLSSSMSGEREKLAGLREELRRLKEESEGFRASIIKVLNSRSIIKEGMARYDTMLETARSRKSELEGRLIKSRTDEKSIEEAMEKAGEEGGAVAADLKLLEEEKQERSRQLEKLENTGEELKSSHQNLEIKYHEFRTSLDNAVNISERYEGYGQAVRRVMSLKGRDQGIVGVVADLIKVESRYETAIETALGGAIQNIVTRDEACARRMIEFLKGEKAGRATFLPIDAIQRREIYDRTVLAEEGVIGSADSLVSTEKGCEAVASNLLGSFLVVENMDSALRIARKYSYRLRIVTLSGEALHPGGSISGGSYRNSSNLLGRSRQIDELKQKMKETLRQIDRVLESLEETQDGIRGERSAIEAVNEKLELKRADYNRYSQEMEHLKSLKENSDSGRSQVLKGYREIDGQILDLMERKGELEKKLSDSVKEEEDFEQKAQEALRQSEKVSESVEKIEARIAESDRRNASLLQEQRYSRQEQERLRGAVRRAKSEMESARRGLKENASEIKKIQEKIEELQDSINSSDSGNQTDRQELEEIYLRREELKKKQEELIRQRDTFAERRTALEKDMVRIEGQKEKAETAIENLISYIWDEYELTPSEAEAVFREAPAAGGSNPDAAGGDASLSSGSNALDAADGEAGPGLGVKDVGELRKKAGEMKSHLKSLGDVNVSSIESYRELMERFNFMNSQREDITRARGDLERTIKELDENMKAQFSERFREISVQFDIVFKELFGGGQGTLELTDTGNLLETDIKITAQPPGKKLQNMLQLSGGEKALSAISLLFAIQNLKPSPFCLLDEIEAALDEANVDRFASYLKKLTEHTQFIVITHRRGTMMKADRLYGITMQEKGISTQVNVDLTDEWEE